MSELTEAEMARERRAEQIEKDMLGDFDEFKKWMSEEFAFTGGAAKVHFAICCGKRTQAGNMLEDMWTAYCKAKSFEQAENVSSNEERGFR